MSTVHGISADTKICNADTYSQCLANISPSSGMFGPGKIGQQKLQQTLIEANRLKSEAVKAHHMAHLIRLETNKILNSNRLKQQQINNSGDVPLQIVRPTRPAKIAVTQRPNRKQNNPPKIATSQKQPAQNIRKPTKKPQGKRRIPCKQEGKLADNLSQNHYFLCFKDQTKTMRARRLQCPAKLIFCPTSLVCTAIERCASIKQ